MNKNLNIRNSTAEFLIFTSQSELNSIEVKVHDENVWLTQKLIAQLFDVKVPAISKHLKNIFESGELDEKVVVSKMEITTKHGAIEDKIQTKDANFYSLDAIISIGYRVNSKKATQFRQWDTRVLKEFAIKGFVLDKTRLENGSFLGKEYFDELLEQIREIRLSERKFYQKITDIYATSIDYNKDDQETKEFFSKVQNKLHYGIHGQTVPELIVNRANSQKEYMGLTSWKNAPEGKIIKSDVSISKNYLTKDELESLGRIVNAYLDLAEERTKRNIPMTMEDWAKRLDIFLEFDDREVLKDSGKVTVQIAKEFALSEFEKYRVIQDKIYLSDFDRLMGEL